MIEIKPLELKYLEDAVSINQKIFPDDYVDPRESIEASLNPEMMVKFEKRLAELGEPHTRLLLYWVAVENTTDTVLGTTGIYERFGEPSDLCWLGWFAVDPEYRGKGIGTDLLDFTLQKAKKWGSKLYVCIHQQIQKKSWLRKCMSEEGL